MSKTFKRFFAIILAAVMVFSTFTVGGFAKDKVSTKDNVVFSVDVGMENDDLVEITLSLVSGSVSYFDFEMVCPSGYVLEEIEKSDDIKEMLFSGSASMSSNVKDGKISFASIEPYELTGKMFGFIYEKPHGENADASDFKIRFSTLGGEDESYAAIVFYDNSEELSVTVSPQSRELHYKDSEMITVGISGCTDCEISFTSSNPKVVKVDENGNIYAAKRGTATITCTVTDSNGNTVSDTCKVTVKYTWWQWIIKIVFFGGWIWD